MNFHWVVWLTSVLMLQLLGSISICVEARSLSSELIRLHPNVSKEDATHDNQIDNQAGEGQDDNVLELLEELKVKLDTVPKKWDDYRYIRALRSADGSLYVPRDEEQSTQRHLATLVGFAKEILLTNNHLGSYVEQEKGTSYSNEFIKAKNLTEDPSSQQTATTNSSVSGIKMYTEEDEMQDVKNNDTNPIEDDGNSGDDENGRGLEIEEIIKEDPSDGYHNGVMRTGEVNETVELIIQKEGNFNIDNGKDEHDKKDYGIDERNVHKVSEVKEVINHKTKNEDGEMHQNNAEGINDHVKPTVYDKEGHTEGHDIEKSDLNQEDKYTEELDEDDFDKHIKLYTRHDDGNKEAESGKNKLDNENYDGHIKEDDVGYFEEDGVIQDEDEDYQEELDEYDQDRRFDDKEPPIASPDEDIELAIEEEMRKQETYIKMVGSNNGPTTRSRKFTIRPSSTTTAIYSKTTRKVTSAPTTVSSTLTTSTTMPTRPETLLPTTTTNTQTTAPFEDTPLEVWEEGDYLDQRNELASQENEELSQYEEDEKEMFAHYWDDNDDDFGSY